MRNSVWTFVWGLVKRVRRSLSSGMMKRLARPLQRRPSRRRRGDGARRPVDHADERTIRRMAEAEHGGVSSQESAARYTRGENPGGTHAFTARRDEGPEHPRPGYEEPQARVERAPGKDKHMSEVRRG